MPFKYFQWNNLLFKLKCFHKIKINQIQEALIDATNKGLQYNVLFDYLVFLKLIKVKFTPNLYSLIDILKYKYTSSFYV